MQYDYIIIGAGPAGLQAAYFLEKYRSDSTPTPGKFKIKT